VTREWHKLSTEELNRKDTDEFLRLHHAICMEKQRWFDLNCWKVYYSSFDQQQPSGSSQDLMELQNRVKELMKLDIDTWWRSEWQSVMDHYILNRQVSIQRKTLELLGHIMGSLEDTVEKLDSTEKNVQQEAKLLVSYHYGLHQVHQLLDSFSKKWNQCAVIKN
jgi:hypothetical protein